MPPHFRFAAKLPREITHSRKLVDTAEPVERFLEAVSALGPKLGPLLVQLPPSLVYDETLAEAFFADFRGKFGGQLACEPRHASWFDDAADALLAKHRVARVAADPAVVPRAAVPGGWPGFGYTRLHGSPRIYYSAYPPETIATTARTLRDASGRVGEQWCIFDNTASGAATGQALELTDRLRGL